MINVTLLVLFVVFALLLTRSIGSLNKRFSLSYNLQFWLIAGYLLLLLISPLIVKLLPSDGLRLTTVNEEEMEKELHRQMQIEGDLHFLASEGRPEEVEGALVLGQWEFPAYQEKAINLVSFRKGEHYDPMIIVEQKDREDNRIEAINYATQTILEGIDYTEEIEAHQLALEGQNLKVTVPRQLEVRIGGFKKEFMVTQILGQETRIDGLSPQMLTGTQLLYLRVPADVEVRSDMPFDYVE